MMGYYYGNGIADSAWWFMGPIMMILWWVLVITAIMFFVKWVVRQSHDGYSRHLDHKKPMDILKERYAKGEISKGEFDEMKKDIA